MNRSALASAPERLDSAWHTVESRPSLARQGWTPSAVRAQLDARRWQRVGRAVVLHNGARIVKPPQLRMAVHWVKDWQAKRAPNGICLLPNAVVEAAGTFRQPRPACGILAAAVQQRLTTANELRRNVLRRHRMRNRALLLSVLADIEGGAEALSEIDFAR
jgi:hypothetical protein